MPNNLDGISVVQILRQDATGLEIIQETPAGNPILGESRFAVTIQRALGTSTGQQIPIPVRVYLRGAADAADAFARFKELFDKNLEQDSITAREAFVAQQRAQALRMGR